MSQPTTTDLDETPRLAAEFVYLLIAIVAGIIALAVWWIQLTDHTHAGALQGAFDIIRVIAVLSGCGYLVRSAETRVERRLGHQSVDADEARREGYASGYVDGVARREPESAAALRSVR